MSHRIPALLASLALASPAYGQTAIPECAKHLFEPAPGQVLTMAQIDANNACLTVMQQAKQVSDLGTAMQENERRLKEKDKAQSLPADGTHSAFDVAPPAPAPERHAEGGPAQPTAGPPTFDTIWVDARTAGAILRFADGSSQEVARGSILPDGSVVAAITTHQVVLRRPDHALLVLRGSSDAPTPTRIIAVPGASSLVPPPTRGP